MITPTERPKPTSPRSITGLAPFIKPYRVQIGLALVFLVLAALATLAFPLALRGLIDGGLVSSNAADKGAQVKAFEPNKPDAEIEGVPAVDSLSKALEDAELVLVLVGHKEFRSLEATLVVKQTPARLLVDAVNVMPAEAFKQAGFRVFRLGVGHEL